MYAALRRHGGNAPRGVLDFSAPSNPLGTPLILHQALVDCVSQGVYQGYPNPHYKSFKEFVAELHRIPMVDTIVPVNGAAEAYTLILGGLRPRTLIVVEPTFGDHHLLEQVGYTRIIRIVLRLGGQGVIQLDVDKLIEAARRAEQPSLIVISRPNNPTGFLVSRRVLEEVYTATPSTTQLLVDEAFIDFCCDPGLEKPSEWVTVRSLTKAFGLQGLRIGYLVSANTKTLRLLDALRQPWPVNSLAECMSTKTIGYIDELRQYLDAARGLIARELARLKQVLSMLGLNVYAGHAPYILVRHPGLRHPELNRRLLRLGVYVRDASSFYSLDSEYSRISIKLPHENDTLVEALVKLLWGS